MLKIDALICMHNKFKIKYQYLTLNCRKDSFKGRESMAEGTRHTRTSFGDFGGDERMK